MVGQGGLQEITSLLEIKAISLAVIMVKLLEDYALQLGQFRLISLKLQQSFFKCREALPVWSTTNEEGVAQHFITFTLRHAHLYLHSRVQGKSFWASVCTLGSVVDLNHQLVFKYIIICFNLVRPSFPAKQASMSTAYSWRKLINLT